MTDVKLIYELRDLDNEVEPVSMYATHAEIVLAEQLRHRLEERYFGTSAPSAAPQPGTRDSATSDFAGPVTKGKMSA